MKNLVKFKIICFQLLTILAFNYAYGSEKTLLEDSKKIKLTLDKSTLRCSSLGYGMRELKVNLKALDGWTILDHSNAAFGEFNGQPCMTAGACQPAVKGFNLEEILNDHAGITSTIVFRKIKESKQIVETAENNENIKVCRRTITESLEANIVGISFHHSRSFSQDFNEQACQ